MAVLDISPKPQSERFSEKTDLNLIEMVQERNKLVKSGIDGLSSIIRAGDRALAELFRRYESLLWKEAMFVSNSVDVGDAYAAALKALGNAINKFRIGFSCALVTFALPIVRNAIKKLLNDVTKQREKAEKFEVIALPYHEDKLIDSYEVEQREQQKAALKLEVEQLKPNPQKVVEMRQAGMSFKDIAAFFGRSPDAIRMVYNRAILRLTKRLSGEVKPIEVEETPVPQANWMQRLRTRFLKTVRFSEIRDISSSSISIQSATTKESQCLHPQTTVEPPHHPGSHANVSPNGRLTSLRSALSGFIRSCLRGFLRFHSTD